MLGQKQKRTSRRKYSFLLDKACDKRTRPQYYDTLKDRFVCHALDPERTKALVFVFVLAHEQATGAVHYVIWQEVNISPDGSSDFLQCNN